MGPRSRNPSFAAARARAPMSLLLNSSVATALRTRAQTRLVSTRRAGAGRPRNRTRRIPTRAPGAPGHDACARLQGSKVTFVGVRAVWRPVLAQSLLAQSRSAGPARQRRPRVHRRMKHYSLCIALRLICPANHRMLTSWGMPP
eukprot:SAG31_NODE_3153_length_4614_cov_6.385604_3_plen_144_part_00